MTGRQWSYTFLSTILLLLLLRLLWGVVAAHRLERELALVRPTPLTVAELFSSVDPDPANNAVPLLIEAMAIARKADDDGVSSPSQSNQVFNNAPPFPPAWHQLTDASIAANAKAFTLVREARGRTAIRWTLPPAAKYPTTPHLPGLNAARDLANVLADAAMDAHDRGDNAQAFRLLRDELFLSRAIDAQRTFISHFVSIGITSMATQRGMIIASGITSAPAGSPVRAEMEALGRELSDPADETRGMRDAFVAERVEQLQTLAQARREAWVTRPVYELDLARALRADRTLIRASDAPTWPAARAMLRAEPAMPDSVRGIKTNDAAGPRFSRMLGDRLIGFTEGAIQVEMRARCERRFAATSLAIACYRADHNGAFPPTLGALVPAYLPSVPVDALGTNRPLNYLTLAKGLPDGRDRHVLYSVGEDDIDATAAGRQSAPSAPEYGWNNVRPPADDQYRDLDRWPTPNGPPATAPTTQSDDGR